MSDRLPGLPGSFPDAGPGRPGSGGGGDDALAALGVLSNGVVIQRAGGEITFCNPAAERILGLSRDQMAGLTSLDPGWRAIHEDGSPFPGEDHPAMVTLRTGAASRGVVMGVHRPDGTLRWISIDADPIPGPGGQPASVVSSFVDVTDRLRAQERYGTLFREMLNGFALHEIIRDETGRPVDYRFLEVNPAFEQMTGLKADQVVGRTVLEVLPGIEAHWIESYGRVALTGEPIHFEDYSAGLGKHFEVTAFRPAPDQFAAIFGEISERRATEDALREGEERLRLVLHGSQLGYWDWNLETGEVARNERWAEMLGYKLDETEFSVKQWIDFVHPDDRDAALKSIQDHVEGRSSMHRVEYRMRTKDGQYRWILDQAHVVRWDSSHRAVRMSGTHTDVTERKRIEEELELHRERLEDLVEERTRELDLANAALAARNVELRAEVRRAEEANLELESFSYSVSHDLRAPVRAIDGFARLLEKHAGASLDEEGRRLLATVQKNSLRMGHLIDDLLAYARAGRSEVRRVEIDMARLVSEVLTEVIPLERREQFEVRVDDLPPAQGDRGLVRQVFVNLLQNAAKFAGPKARPVVEVGFRQAGGVVEYFVRDNGVGFDQRYAGKLFGVFQRLHSEKEYPGTGIGLSLVRRIVEKHGGYVRAEGVVGEGATFFFTLGPARTGAETTQAPASVGSPGILPASGAQPRD